MFSPDRYVAALEFAAQRHLTQKIPGSDLPYVVHVTSVAAEVIAGLATTPVDNSELAVLCALLHDAIEDTPTTREELEQEFGREVADIVAEVTDDKSLPKAQRKRLQVETAPRKSHRAKLVKIADKTSNLWSIAKTPPVDWDLKRQREYFDWAARVVAGCRGTNATLERWFDEAHAAGLEALAKR